MTDKIYRKITHRCFTIEYPDLPFRARSLGHSNIAPETAESIVRREFIEMYWGIAGEGTFNIDGQKYQLRPGEVCFYTFGDLHDMYAATDYFQYRWITFDGAQAMSLWSGLNLPKTPRLVGPCPEELYCRLEHEILDYSLDGLRKATATAFNILMLGACSPQSTSAPYNYTQRAKQIMEENFRESAFNINTLAQELHINRSQLSRRFTLDYGIGLVKYLTHLRIEHGSKLLASSDLPLSEIARQSGFSNPSYFARCIRLRGGKTVRRPKARKITE